MHLDLVALDEETTSLTQTGNEDIRILRDKLDDAEVPRLASMSLGSLVEIVRIDLEGDKPECAEALRLSDRHIVGRHQRRAGDIGPCTPAGVRDPKADGLTDRLHQPETLHRGGQHPGITSTDEDGGRLLDRSHGVVIGVQPVDLDPKGLKRLIDLADILIVGVGDGGVGHEDHLLTICLGEEVIEIGAGLLEVALAGRG